jgi:hypothetical protein
MLIPKSRETFAQGEYGRIIIEEQSSFYKDRLILRRSVSIQNKSDYHRVITFDLLSFIAHILLAPRDRTGPVDEMAAARFILPFASAWQPFDVRKLMLLSNDYASKLVLHDIGFYSVANDYKSNELPCLPGLVCYREDGLVPVPVG